MFTHGFFVQTLRLKRKNCVSLLFVHLKHYLSSINQLVLVKEQTIKIDTKLNNCYKNNCEFKLIML